MRVVILCVGLVWPRLATPWHWVAKPALAGGCQSLVGLVVWHPTNACSLRV